MTRQEAARKYVDTLSNEQCRELLATALLATLPHVFIAVERETTPNWEEQQICNELEVQRQSISYPCCCYETINLK